MFFQIVIGLIGLGIIIFIHESGHFIAAKINGIEVEVFSLGFGRKILGFKRGNTQYQISLIPFGGYCKLKGDEVLKNAAKTELTEIPEEEGSFFSASPLKRIVVAFAGPLANFVFAVVILSVIWWVGFSVYSSSNKIILASDYFGYASNKIPPATKAGLKTGDVIISVDGRKIRNFQDLVEVVSTNPGKKLDFVVKRDGKVLTIPVMPELDKNTGSGRIGVYSWINPVVEKVLPGKGASLAGIRAGDIIVGVNGRRVENTLDIFKALKDKPGKVVLRVKRGTSVITIPVVVTYDESGNPDLGIYFKERMYREGGKGIVYGFKRGVEETIDTMGMTLKGIVMLFRGINIHNTVAGPLRISYYLGEVTKSGFELSLRAGIISFVRLLSLLSIVLVIMNLLPLPALDGGQILLFVIEIVRRKRVSPKLIYRVQVIGFSFIIIVAVMITFSDILFFIGK